MKSFKIYILEADYTRFLKKNPNLNLKQVNKINTFFQRDKNAAKDFEKKYGWQSKAIKELTWEDFEDIMMKTKTGRKINFKNIKIPGKKGEDYWPMKLSKKVADNFIAIIPLKHKTAQFLNSDKFGSKEVNYCIGWPKDDYWVDYVIRDKMVPIYITDGIDKWVVMILENNKTYQVWDKFNKENLALTNKEPIPGFPIKKELIGSKQAKLYDEIRKKHYKVEKDDAIRSYNLMVSDILSYARQLAREEELWYEEIEKIRKDTIEYYRTIIDNKKNIIRKFKYDIEKINNGEYDNEYNEADKERIKEKLRQLIIEKKEEIEKINELIEEIKEMTPYDMIEYNYDKPHNASTDNYDYIEWAEDFYPYENDYIYEPQSTNKDYQDYFAYLKTFEPQFNVLYAFNDLYELSDGGDWASVDEEEVREWLEFNDMPHPNDL